MNKNIFIVFVLAIIGALVISNVSFAQPYGKGLYGIVTYGNETSLTISTDGNVNIPTITPLQSGTLGTGNSTVNVVSTDVMGYKLYVRALTSASMNNLGTPLPSSTFSYPGATKDVWGYNTDLSDNYTAMTLSDAQIYSATQPTTGAGHDTIVKYGLYIDFAKPAGNYTVDVIYTAVPQTN